MNDQPLLSYSLTHHKHTGSIAVLNYNLMGKLVNVEFNEEASDIFIKAILTRVPSQNTLLPALAKEHVVISDVTKLDLSFDKFWNLYAYKIGKKPRIEKIFNKLSKEDKILAIGSIPRLKRFYESKNQNLPYADTYINNRYWENEYQY